MFDLKIKQYSSHSKTGFNRIIKSYWYTKDNFLFRLLNTYIKFEIIQIHLKKKNKEHQNVGRKLLINAWRRKYKS